MAAGVKPKVGFVCGVKGVATQVKLWSSETWGQGLGLRVYVFLYDVGVTSHTRPTESP